MLESQLMACLFEQDSFEGDVAEFKMAHGEERVDIVAESSNMCEAVWENSLTMLPHTKHTPTDLPQQSIVWCFPLTSLLTACALIG